MAVKTQKNKIANEVIIDAKGKVLGRLASDIAFRLQGKDDPSYTPNKTADIKIRVKNASSVKVTGRKNTDKTYWRHSGYPGGIYNKKYKEIFEKNPQDVIRMAVYNMLPKNKLRKESLKNLIIEN
ncbi:MAG: 50S ribosomal protein L13 [Candidatus Spechtbacterales bacterium]